MNKIARLSQHLVNKIAAGEVVERCGSVVKELLENSLDAGANRITVDIEDGGKKLIRISDNGCGIPAEELPLAFAPHATSKIAQEEDLFAIGTMGFRGEALASIASVSQVEITSRTQDVIEGARLENSAGELGSVVPAAASVGTVITVRNLFFNTPARRKFLRTANTEMGHITEQFTRIGLAHTEVQLGLTHNNRKIHELPADQSLRERIAALFSAELAHDLMSIERKDHGIEVRGLIGPPHQSRPGSRWQYVFLNGRHIRDRFIAHAIREAYRGMMEINRQPVVFLFIKIAPDKVDVNVHPAKTEVRFADSNAVHSQVLAAIRDRLLSTDLSVPLQSESLEQAEGAEAGESGARETPQERQLRVRGALADFFKSSPAPSPTSVRSDYRATEPAYKATEHLADFKPSAQAKTFSDTSMLAGSKESGEQAISSGGEVSSAPEQKPTFVQVHNSYLVTESKDGLLIIDQHALHERIIYERLYEQVKDGTLMSQRSLIPETCDVTAEQMTAIENAAEMLKSLGIIIEQFGPGTIAVQGFPVLLKKLAPADFLADLADLLVAHSDRLTREELLHEVLDMMACKAAVKAGDPLSEPEIKNLLAQRHLTERSGNCPHGRPTAVRLSLAQLEKQFKRS